MILSVIIPVYKKSFLSESKTIVTLCEMLNVVRPSIKVKIHVWNNGPCLVVNNIPFNIYFDLDVVQSTKNCSLAMVYNTVIEKNSNSDCYLILDDDTEITSQFLDEVIRFIMYRNDILAVPTIACADRIVSPVYESLIRRIYTGTLNSSNFRAIGSGLVIPSSVIKTFIHRPFDENLTLYGIDTKFCYDYRELFNEFYVLRTTLNHDVAGFKVLPLDNFKFREINLAKAMLYIILNCKGVRA
ncbi:glycosyltransferase family 2 protein, partial [Vibrio lentus]